MSIILNASIVILTHHYYHYCTSRFPAHAYLECDELGLPSLMQKLSSIPFT